MGGNGVRGFPVVGARSWGGISGANGTFSRSVGSLSDSRQALIAATPAGHEQLKRPCQKCRVVGRSDVMVTTATLSGTVDEVESSTSASGTLVYGGTLTVAWVVMVDVSPSLLSNILTGLFLVTS